MAERISRLERSEIKRVRAQGINRRSPHFSLFYSASRSQQTGALAITISKKVAKTAVERNQLRRRIRAILRDEIRGNSPQAFVLVARSGAASLSYQDLSHELQRLFSQTTSS